ncbi:MAG: hypothetical protein LBH60_00450 [Prevotellaceae bacterium]|nr:hypothetical protein [Prevotellaceae bacterium]
MPKPLKTDEGYAVSLYTDSLASPDEIVTAISRLKIAFPKMGIRFFAILSEFIIKHEFTGKRLTDAVDHVISDFQYKELNISDIIRFDRRKRLYTYNEMCTMIHKGEARTTDDFVKREIDGKLFWVKK